MKRMNEAIGGASIYDIFTFDVFSYKLVIINYIFRWMPQYFKNAKFEIAKGLSEQEQFELKSISSTNKQ